MTSLRLGVLDDMIIDLAAEVTKLGVDCPLGWPDDFVAFVNAHRIGDVVAPQDLAGKDWRRRLPTAPPIEQSARPRD